MVRIECLPALGADHCRLSVCPTVMTKDNRRTRISCEPHITPAKERHHYRIEVSTHWSESVFEPIWMIAVGSLLKDAVSSQLRQSL
jgi:hypothetical protein